MMHVSGDEQVGRVGVALDPLVVTLKDENGQPRFEEPVEFRIVKGEGAITFADKMTGIDGRAAAEFVPSAPGRYRIEVNAADGQELRTHAFVGITEEAAAPAEPPGGNPEREPPPSDERQATSVSEAETPKKPAAVPRTPRQRPQPTRARRVPPNRAPQQHATPSTVKWMLLVLAFTAVVIAVALKDDDVSKTASGSGTIIDASRCTVNQLSIEGNDLVFDNCATVTR